MREYSAKVVSNKKIQEGCYLLSLDVGKSPLATVIPGQFAMVGTKPEDGILLRRPYSVFDYASQGNKKVLSFFYEVVGKGTRILSLAKSGETLSLLAPLGNGFDLKELKGKYLCIVMGGFGVVPFYLLMKLAKKYNPAEILIFYGAKSKSKLFFADVFDRTASKIFLATDDGSRGYKGLVSELFKEKIEDGKEFKGIASEKILVYTCGPREMMRKVSSESGKMGFKCYVSMEEVMGCGFGVCLSCVVESRKSGEEYLTTCKDGPVFDARAIVI